jgi:hypothetical protein
MRVGMSSVHSLTCNIDNERRFFFFTHKGRLLDRIHIDELIATMETIPEPWTYDFIIDHYESVGRLPHSEFTRFAQWGHIIAKGARREGHLIVLTADPIYTGLTKAGGPLFPGFRNFVCLTFEDALKLIQAEK